MNLSSRMDETYENFRQVRSNLSDDDVLEILEDGSKRAKEIAQKTVAEVKEFMLMDYARGK